MCPLCCSKKIRHWSRPRGETDLYSCLKCGGFFVDPRPSSDSLRDFYAASDANDEGGVPKIDRDGQVSIPHWKEEDVTKYFQWVDALIERKTGDADRIQYLDIGCQVGVAMMIARDRFNWHPFGVEVWPPADAILTSQHLSHAMVSLEEFSSTDQYDVISLFDVLEHLRDVDRSLEKIGQLLSPAGILLIAVPNARGLFPFLFHRLKYRWLKMRKRQETWDPLPFPFHLWWFSKPGLSALLERHGFTIVVLKTDSTHRMMNWQRKSATWKRALYTLIQVIGKSFGLGNRIILIAQKGE